MIKIESLSIVFPPNCIVLLVLSNVWRAHTTHKKMTLLNRTVKNSLIKVLDSNPSDYPFVIEDVLFAPRVTTRVSTKYSPFELLYNRETFLTIDIKHNTKDLSNLGEIFDKDIFDTVLESVTSLRNRIHHKVEDNIKKAQEK